MLGRMVKASGIRARNRAALESEILDAAARSLADVGASGLSLRALARELDMAPSALYRYYASRDELLTRLIVRSFDSLGDAVDDALASGPADPRGRFAVIARATRSWAKERPHEYALLYGTPVPRYHAPAEQTTGPGTRVTEHLLALLAQFGRGRPEPDADAAGPLAAAAAGLAPVLGELGPGAAGLTPELVVRGQVAWNLILGSLSCELFEQFGPGGLGDADAHFDAAVELALGIVDGPAAG